MKATPLQVVLLAAWVATASAASISTGVASWQVDGNPAVVTAVQFNYLPNFGDGQWVSVGASPFTSPGSYTFTLAIGSLIGSGGSFSLQYGADNSVTWSITNGSLAGETSCLTPDGDCFGSDDGAPRPLSGTFAADSVLTAVVINDGGTVNPMALLAVGTAEASSSDVPEPSTFSLSLVIGGMALGSHWWRRAARRRRPQ